MTGEPLKTTDDIGAVHSNNSVFRDGLLGDDGAFRQPHPDRTDFIAEDSLGLGIASRLNDKPQGVACQKKT